MIVIWLWNSSERGLTPLKAFLMMHQFQQMSQTKRRIKDAAILLVQKSIALNGGLRCNYGSRKPEGLVNFENVYVKRGLEWLNLWVHHWICRHQSLIRCHFWGGLKSWTWVGNKRRWPSWTMPKRFDGSMCSTQWDGRFPFIHPLTNLLPCATVELQVLMSYMTV